MTEPTPGLPVRRPGTPVRYWPDRREGDGETGLTQGGPFMVDGVPAVYIAGHEAWIPLARVEAADPSEAEIEALLERTRETSTGRDT